MVVLAGTGLVGIISIAKLASDGHQVPDALVALTTAAFGAVGGVLSPSPAEVNVAGSAASTTATPATTNTMIYAVFIATLGLIALTGLAGLIWLTKVNADLQLDLLRAAVHATSGTVTSAPPSVQAVKASSSAETSTVQIPGGIVAIASAAVGTLGSLFVPSPASK